MGFKHQEISKFTVTGINYKKTNTNVRGLYAINQETYLKILENAPRFNVKELFVLSTCNRTEIYGFCDDQNILGELLCLYSNGDFEDFKNTAYFKKGKDAIEHLFNVSAGLDSQILGDYEILGQIKLAVKFSKDNNCIGAYMERLVNAVLQSSKEIKTNTTLSGGTVSVSFAAIQYIKEQIKNVANSKIVIFGTGKIGRNTCKNLIHYLNTKNITVINRTNAKALDLSKELQLNFAPIENFSKELNDADIIIVSTNSDKPVILKSHLQNTNKKLIIDLSVPCNVENEVKNVPNITLVNVDELSKIKDETLQMRISEIPKANAIIKKHITEYKIWHSHRKHVPMLKSVKMKLEEINQNHFFINEDGSKDFCQKYANEKIQKVISNMAIKLREKNQKGCHYIEAINEYISSAVN